MYATSQITPLEWRRASVCNHEDDNEIHCKNSVNSFDGHEAHFINTQDIDDGDDDGGGNCGENYSTLERYLKNVSELSEESDAWMNMEYRQNFLERRQKQRNQQQKLHQENKIRSSRNFDENLDIDDDGLIGFEEARPSGSYSTYALDDEDDEHDEMNNIELISYENNFNLYNSFWWAMGTLIQTTSDLYPKVFFFCLLKQFV